MIILMVLLAAGTTTAAGTELCSTCLLIDRTCYNTTYLFDLQAPFRKQIVIRKTGVMRSKNIFYFSFEPDIEDREHHKIGFVNIDKPKEASIIQSEQIFNFGAFDIDQKNNVVYLGGTDGIYVLNADKMRSYSSRGDTVTNIFYKNNVYFTLNKGITVKDGDYFKTYLEYIAVKNFVIGKFGIFVYLANTGLYVSNGKQEYRLSANAFFRGMAVDIYDNVYVWWLDGIYKVIVDKTLNKSIIVKIVEVEGIETITFDKENNILLTNKQGLYKMIKTEHGCVST